MNDIPILQIDVIDTEQHVAESRLEMQRMRNYMLRNEVNACETVRLRIHEHSPGASQDSFVQRRHESPA